MIAYLYSLIYTITVCLIVVFSGESYLGLTGKLLPAAVVAVLLCMMTAAVRYAKKKYKILMAGILIVFATGIFVVVKSENRISLLQEYRWIGWMLFLAIASYAVAQILITVFWARRMVLLLLVMFMGVYLFQGTVIGKAPVTLAIFLLLLLLAEEIQRGWKKSGYTHAGEHTVSVVPFIIIICAIVYKLPAPKEPYDWRVSHYVYELAVDGANRISGLLFHREDEYSGVGFSEDGEIAGNIGTNDKKIMEITAEKGVGKVLYLSGRMYDVFDGRGWSATADAEAKSRMLDTFETECAVQKYDSDDEKDYLADATINLKYHLYNTRYIFLPLKPQLSNPGALGLAIEEYPDRLLSEKRLNYGTEYKVRFCRMNRNADEFCEFLRAAEPFDEQDWDKVANKNPSGRTTDYSYESLLEYRRQMQDIYYSKVEPSEELKVCLKELYEGTRSPIERLERLEAWLHSFSYTASPGKLPEGVQTPEQFLDYFLLEKREGYCVHFATAFALLARAEGFPTRYVQGYCVKGANSGKVIVTAKMAHAWPEVYIENVGWIPFEPTPGYETTAHWAVKRNDGGSRVNYREIPQKSDPSDELLSNGNKEKEVRKIGQWKIIVLPLVCAILFLVAYLMLARLIVACRYRKLDAKGKAVVLCKRCMRRLAMLGWKLKKGETLEEYGRRIAMDAPPTVLSFIDCYEKISYSDADITPQMLAAIEASDRKIFALLKRKVLSAGTITIVAGNKRHYLRR